MSQPVGVALAGVQQNLDKKLADLAVDKQRRDELQDAYNKQIERQRQYEGAAVTCGTTADGRGS